MISQIKMRRGTTAEWAAASPVVLAAGEPGWDSTLKGVKVGDGSTEWAALPWIDAKNADIRLGQNILDNWNFTNPINQRGISGNVANGMAIDRWIFVGAWVESGHVHLYPVIGYYIEQRIETSIARLSGKTFTATLLCDLGYVKATGTWPATGSTYLNLTSDGSYRAELMADVNGWPTLRLHTTDLPNKIYAVKLELGESSTLHLDPPMDYGVELAKCQRYCVVFNSVNDDLYSTFGVGFGNTTSEVKTFMSFPVTMRVVPTLLFSSPDTFNLHGAGQNFVVTSMLVARTTRNALGISSSISPSTSIYPGYCYFLRSNNNNNAYIIATSDL